MNRNSPLQDAGNFVNCKWRVTSKIEGVFEGILKNYTPSNLCFSFEKVSLIKVIGEERICDYIGQSRVFYDEILDAEVIDDHNKVQRYLGKNCSNEPDYNQYLIPFSNKSGVCKTRNSFENNGNNNYGDDDDDDDEEEEEELEGSGNLVGDVAEYREEPGIKPWKIDVKSLYEEASNLVAKIVSREYEGYEDVIDEINKSESIGLAACGKDISRFGEIEYLIVSTMAGNYVFKGDKEIMEDLKKPLESSYVLKVLFDTRFLSDALRHIYHICIQNVFDCQVMDFFVQQDNQRTKHLVKKFRTFQDCIKDYLGVNLFIEETDYQLLSKTPLPIAAESYVRKKVVLLRELKYVQIHLHLYKITQSFEIQLNAYREANDLEYRSLLEAGDLVHLMFDECSSIRVNRTNLVKNLNVSNKLGKKLSMTEDDLRDNYEVQSICDKSVGASTSDLNNNHVNHNDFSEDSSKSSTSSYDDGMRDGNGGNQSTNASQTGVLSSSSIAAAKEEQGDEDLWPVLLADRHKTNPSNFMPAGACQIFVNEMHRSHKARKCNSNSGNNNGITSSKLSSCSTLTLSSNDEVMTDVFQHHITALKNIQTNDWPTFNQAPKRVSPKFYPAGYQN